MAGAHTGDVSAAMLADLGCRYVEVGHSERARDHGETRALVGRKAAAAARWGMTPVICVGEAEELGIEAATRADARDALAVILGELVPRPDRRRGHRLRAGMGHRRRVPARQDRNASVPSTGPSTRWLEASGLPSTVRVIYGGSVDEVAAPAILAEPGVEGLFVGRVSLDAEAFARIARSPAAARG